MNACVIAESKHECEELAYNEVAYKLFEIDANGVIIIASAYVIG